jgi:hypothetical protein
MDQFNYQKWDSLVCVSGNKDLSLGMEDPVRHWDGQKKIHRRLLKYWKGKEELLLLFLKDE